MSASYKDLKKILESIGAQSSMEDLDNVFLDIIQNESQDLLVSMQLVEDFLIESLHASNELKKVS